LKKARSDGHIPGRKIDPAKGPSRTTAWRQRIGARSIAMVILVGLVVRVLEVSFLAQS
jgi:hypothetical protein